MHRWLWTERPHIDRKKQADATEVMLRSGQITLAEVHARQGRDWLPEIQQRAQEVAELERTGQSVSWTDPAMPTTPANEEDDDDEAETLRESAGSAGDA
jgi:capsid protein